MGAWLSSQLPSRPVVAPAWLRPFPLFLILRDLSATQLHPQRQAPIPARPALPTPHYLGLPPAGQAGEPQSGEGPLPPRLEHQRRYRASRALYPHSPPPLTGVTHRFQACLTSRSCSLATLRPNRELEAGLGALRHPGRRQEWLELAGVWGQGAKGRGSGRLPAEGRRHHFLSICVATGETLYKPHHSAPPEWEPRFTLSLSELTGLPGAEGDSRPCLGVQEL